MKTFGMSIVVPVVALLVGSTASVAFGQMEERGMRPSLSVVGNGKVSAVPDVADIILGVVTQSTTAKDALNKNNAEMNALQTVLKERGIASKDIETTQIQISPVYSQPTPRQQGAEEFVPRVVGYRVVNAVEVTARDITKLGDLLDAVVQAGANQVNGITLRVDKPEALLDEARRRAMADAKRKAELIAGEAKVVLGLAQQIVESGAMSPRPYSLGAQAPMMMMRSAPAPVAAGEQELSVSIQVSYAIMAPKS